MVKSLKDSIMAFLNQRPKEYLALAPHPRGSVYFFMFENVAREAFLRFRLNNVGPPEDPVLFAIIYLISSSLIRNMSDILRLACLTGDIFYGLFCFGGF